MQARISQGHGFFLVVGAGTIWVAIDAWNPFDTIAWGIVGLIIVVSSLEITQASGNGSRTDQ